MKNKVLLSIMGLLLVSLGITMSITNHKRSQIAEVRKEVSQVAKTQKHVTTQIVNLQTTYNANDAIAKRKLLEFAKAYYTFSSQSDYDRRFSKAVSYTHLLVYFFVNGPQNSLQAFSGILNALLNWVKGIGG